MLSIENLVAGYIPYGILRGVDMHVEQVKSSAGRAERQASTV
jgi:hypothetical protein